MNKIDNLDFVMLVFWGTIFLGCVFILLVLMWSNRSTGLMPRFENPPPPPEEKKEPYSFLHVCSYKQLKALADVFPRQKPIMLEDVGDLFVFKKAVDRQIQLVEQHIKDLHTEKDKNED